MNIVGCNIIFPSRNSMLYPVLLAIPALIIANLSVPYIVELSPALAPTDAVKEFIAENNCFEKVIFIDINDIIVEIYKRILNQYKPTD